MLVEAFCQRLTWFALCGEFPTRLRITTCRITHEIKSNKQSLVMPRRVLDFSMKSLSFNTVLFGTTTLGRLAGLRTFGFEMRVASRHVVVAASVLVPFLLVSCSQPKIEENLDAIAWLPDSASDISHSSGFGWRAWECTMTEDTFVDWAKDDYELTEISEPVVLSRFNTLKKNSGDDTKVTVAGGLHARDHSPGGWGYDLAFDRGSSRVYDHYQAH